MSKPCQPPVGLTYRMTEAMTGIAELLGAWKAVNTEALRPELLRGKLREARQLARICPAKGGHWQVLDRDGSKGRR